MTRMLTIEETADMLSVHPNTIRGMLTKLGAVDLSGGQGKRRLIRIPERNLEAYLRDCEILKPLPAKRAVKTGWKLERRRT